MREDPGHDLEAIASCLEANDGLDVASIVYLPAGHDMRASVYRATTRDGRDYFVKVRTGPVNGPSLRVPAALNDLGIREVLAPLRTRTGDVRRPMPNGAGVILYPFIEGENGKVAGLSDDQWRTFGAAMRAVHESGLSARFQTQLPCETFALQSAALVRQLSALVRGAEFESPTARELSAFWRDRQARIDAILDRAELLGRSLQEERFDLVLCHADIHAANILVEDHGRIRLVDWDGPLIAPRERDLLFVVGSRIARTVEPWQEDLYFEGYGAIKIHRDALIYYRYERIVEDLGEFGRSVFLDPQIGEQLRAAEADLAMSFFDAGGDIDRAEFVPRVFWPGKSA